jgi:arylsulfatase A-like enzyme
MRNYWKLVLVLSALISVPIIYVLVHPGKIKNFNDYDFISSFDSTIKFNFDPEYQLELGFPDKIYSYDPPSIKSKLANLFSNDIKILSRDGRELDSISSIVDAAGFRLVFPSSDFLQTFIFKFKILDDHNYYRLVVSARGQTINTQLAGYKDGIEERIDNFSYQADTGKNNVLVIAFYQDYLVLINDDDVLYQQKDGRFVSHGKISFEYSSDRKASTRYVVKFAEMQKNMEKDLINLMNWNHKTIRDHRFNINDPGWNPPSFRQFMTAEDTKRNYTRRLNMSTEVRPVIYFPINSMLDYEVSIPSDASFEFHLALVPNFVWRMERLRFRVEVGEKGGKAEKAFTVKFPIRKSEHPRFNRFSVDLSKFSGRKKKIILKFDTIDGKLLMNEKNILLACGSPMLFRKRERADKNIILISLDTLRADHLGCYGYHRLTSPNIDKIAAEGTIFLNAASCSNWTLPSHMSMLTGLYSAETGYVPGNAISNTFFADEVKTIASYLRAMNYKTAGFHNGGYMSEFFGFDKGFDLYKNTPKDIEHAMGQVLKWLAENKENKFFLFFHTYEVHAPYTNTYFSSQLSASASFKERSIAKYDGDIHNADQQLERLFKWLKKNDLYENTVIIITSDHGEDFDYVMKEGDAGLHGKSLYDSEVRIPLIIKGGDGFNAGKKITSQVSSVDILPTITGLVEMDIEDGVRGIDLQRLLARDDLQNRLVYIESSYLPQNMKSVRSSNYKLVIKNLPRSEKNKRAGITEYEFFDLSKNNMESDNLWKSGFALGNRYLDYLKEISMSVNDKASRRISGSGGNRVINKELQEQLKALGYLGN